MATLEVIGSGMASQLQMLLEDNANIVPGSMPSYQLCKTIFEFHPLGAKLVEIPIRLAQSQKREIKIPTAPDMVKERFDEQWERDSADKHIRNLARTARMYGIGSLAAMEEGIDPAKPLDFEKLWETNLSFNLFDPLNTAGSLVLNQNPLAIDFQHTLDIRVSGKTFHRSRTVVLMNEEPIYIAYVPSAFGFVGRSVYQRTLFPLKSFLQTMQTDDLVAVKVGTIVAKLKQAGTFIDNIMQHAFAMKRVAVKLARTGNVISIGEGEDIESLNLQNIDAPLKGARQNILMNIASGAGMPAILMLEETYTQGFGEGTEDAKNVARYIDGYRQEVHAPYSYFDKLCFYRAVNPEFYKTVQARFPKEYGNVPFKTAFYQWWNAFTATWPNLLKEPDSELAKLEDVMLRAAVAVYELLRTDVPQEVKADLAIWLADQVNSRKLLFTGRALTLDRNLIAQYEPQEMMDKDFRPPKPMRADSDNVREKIENLQRAIAALPPGITRPQLRIANRP